MILQRPYRRDNELEIAQGIMTLQELTLIMSENNMMTKECVTRIAKRNMHGLHPRVCTA